MKEVNISLSVTDIPSNFLNTDRNPCRGSNCSGRGFCDTVTGTCRCRTGFQGTRCEISLYTSANFGTILNFF